MIAYKALEAYKLFRRLTLDFIGLALLWAVHYLAIVALGG